MGPDGHQREEEDRLGSRILPTMLRPKDICQDWNRRGQAPRGRVLCEKYEQAQVHMLEQGLLTAFMDLLRTN